MLDPRVVIFGAAISLIGTGIYAVGTLCGRVKPNRMSWVLWAFAPLIAFAAEMASGVGWPSLTTLAPGLGPLLVLIASAFNRQSYCQVTRFDVTCGGLSALALALWAATGNGNVAILFSVLADGLASVPTLIKSYREPYSSADSHCCTKSNYLRTHYQRVHRPRPAARHADVSYRLPRRHRFNRRDPRIYPCSIHVLSFLALPSA